VLRQFGDKTDSARALYRSFVEAGISEGRRNDLSGGGLIRSNKGWQSSRDSAHRKGDQRILGSSDLVLEVLKAADERWEHTHALKMEGIDFAAMQACVTRFFNLDAGDILLPGKYPNRVAARSVLCYFLVGDLGMTVTAVAERLGIGQPTVSIAVRRGEALVREKGLSLTGKR
jgi:putative transposase